MVAFFGLLLNCSDVARSLAFYRAAGLDMRPWSRPWGFDYYEQGSPFGFRIRSAVEAQALVTQGAHLTICAQDWRAVREKLIAFGAKPLGTDTFLDPDENVVQIVFGG